MNRSRLCPECKQPQPEKTVYCAYCGSRLGSASALSRTVEWSVILGMLGIFTFGLTSILGVLLGVFALGQFQARRGTLKGSGTIILGIMISLLLGPIIILIMEPVFMGARMKARSITCLENLKAMGSSLMMYAQDYDDHLPFKINWCDALLKYDLTEDRFHCPEVPVNGTLRSYLSMYQKPLAANEGYADYVYNAKLSGLNLSQVANPAETVAIFEGDGSTTGDNPYHWWNPSGDVAALDRRHQGGLQVTFADGHAKWNRHLPASSWEPSDAH